MDITTSQFIYIMCGIILQLVVIVGLFTKSERRMTKIELYLKQCCHSLEIHTGEL